MFHLREAGDDAFDSAVELIQAHGLHAAALKLWPDGTAQHTKIQLLYGGQLRDSKQFVESALVFSQCGSAADALEAWTCAVADEPSTWRWAIVTAEGMDLPLTSMQAACARVGALLVQQHAYTDAALVFCDYAGDVDEGMQLPPFAQCRLPCSLVCVQRNDNLPCDRRGCPASGQALVRGSTVLRKVSALGSHQDSGTPRRRGRGRRLGRGPEHAAGCPCCCPRATSGHLAAPPEAIAGRPTVRSWRAQRCRRHTGPQRRSQYGQLRPVVVCLWYQCAVLNLKRQHNRHQKTEAPSQDNPCRERARRGVSDEAGVKVDARSGAPARGERRGACAALSQVRLERRARRPSRLRGHGTRPEKCGATCAGAGGATNARSCARRHSQRS